MSVATKELIVQVIGGWKKRVI